MHKPIIGVDGCRAGWATVRIRSNIPELFLCLNLEEVTQLAETDSRILIDMPIGFVDQGADGRTCDRLARRILSPRRHSSVFSPPCRAALYEDLDQASYLNFQHTGKKLSRQSINIIPKIRKLDAFLQQLAPAEQDHWYEAHPEVVFAALNRGQVIPQSKKTALGQQQRLEVLSSFLPAIETWYPKVAHQYPRKQLLADDIIDALGLAVASWLIEQADYTLISLPNTPPLDSTGLPMRIVYTEKA